MTRGGTAGETLCEFEKCGAVSGGPRLAVPGLRLCRACGDRLARRLGELPGLHQRAARALNAAVRTSERVAGGRAPGIPLNVPAVEARAAVPALLSSWAQLVVDERRVVPPPRSIAAMAEFVGRHLPWLAAHPAAGDLAEEVRTAHAALVRLLDPRGSRRVPLGSCPVSGCAGTLAAALRPGRSGDRPSDVTCSADAEHRWPTAAWGQLHRMCATVGSVR